MAIPHLTKIPAYDEIEPTKCYTYWEIFLSTANDINSITDVFIFVEDECTIDIHKLSDTNLFQINNF